jgi:hypothetical protein
MFSIFPYLSSVTNLGSGAPRFILFPGESNEGQPDFQLFPAPFFGRANRNLFLNFDLSYPPTAALPFKPFSRPIFHAQPNIFGSCSGRFIYFSHGNKLSHAMEEKHPGIFHLEIFSLCLKLSSFGS